MVIFHSYVKLPEGITIIPYSNAYDFLMTIKQTKICTCEARACATKVHESSYGDKSQIAKPKSSNITIFMAR